MMEACEVEKVIQYAMSLSNVPSTGDIGGITQQFSSATTPATTSTCTTINAAQLIDLERVDVCDLTTSMTSAGSSSLASGSKVPSPWDPSTESEPLLLACQKHNCTYDHTQMSYRDDIVKMNAWGSIADEMARPLTDVPMLKQKFKNLRDSYKKKKATINKQPSGSGARKDIKWEYFDLCDQFLAPFVQIKKTSTNMPGPGLTSETSDGGVISPHFILGEILPPPKKVKKSRDALEDVVVNFIKDQQTSTKSDAMDHFGKFVASSLREMTPRQRMTAQAKIQTVIFESSLESSLDIEQ